MMTAVPRCDDSYFISEDFFEIFQDVVFSHGNSLQALFSLNPRRAFAGP